MTRSQRIALARHRRAGLEMECRAILALLDEPTPYGLSFTPGPPISVDMRDTALITPGNFGMPCA